MRSGSIAAWRRLAAASLLGAGALAGTAQAAIAFAPLYAGSFDAGQGADATFVQIDSSWRASTVLWDEDGKKYGSGQAIGSFDWGTGLWGLADWKATQAAAQGAGGPPIVRRWSGIVETINYGNAAYNADYDQTWGGAALLPLFGSPTPADAQPRHESQENWTSAFSGYIRITAAGTYNFSVLNDDGFFLRLSGAQGATQEIVRDFLNPRERNGFGEDLDLSEGLYAFELGSWNRLEAGVVDLRWNRGGGNDWTLVPVTHLMSASQVPEPAPLALLAAALAAGWLDGQRRKQTRSRA